MPELLWHLLERLTDEAPMPGVAVAVVTPDGTTATAVRGVADLTTGEPVTSDHWWDLASLTKTLVTLPAVLETAGSVTELTRPLGRLWERVRGTELETVTPADLLSHRSGLSAGPALFRDHHGREALVEAVLRLPLAHAEPLYSDMGFVVLGEWIVETTGTPLRAWAARRGLRYGPVAPAAATERCSWRGRLITGEVHDENASAMGGVAGHAGAFGRLSDVADAARTWLAGSAVAPDLHEAATTRWSANTAGERFGLGWWLTPTRGLGGPAAGPDGYGMSGFVGNRLWFEPSRSYAVVILSNRVHPARGPRGPRDTFEAWCDALLSAIARHGPWDR